MKVIDGLNRALFSDDATITRPLDGMISVPYMSKEWCDDVIKLAEDADRWTDNRHKKYNTHDIVLKDLDAQLGTDYLMALNTFVRKMIIDEYHLSTTNEHRWYYETFLVKYSPDEQAGLDLHHDGSVFTSVLTLNDKFEGGGTYFKNQDKTIIGEVGHLSVHPGRLTHYHGANNITSGTRYIIVTLINMQLG